MNGAQKDVALNFIGGHWVDTDDHRSTYDPATGNVIGTYAHASRIHTRAAIDAAAAAFTDSDWRLDRRFAPRCSTGWPIWSRTDGLSSSTRSR